MTVIITKLYDGLGTSRIDITKYDTKNINHWEVGNIKYLVIGKYISNWFYLYVFKLSWEKLTLNSNIELSNLKWNIFLCKIPNKLYKKIFFK